MVLVPAYADDCAAQAPTGPVQLHWKYTGNASKTNRTDVLGCASNGDATACLLEQELVYLSK